MLVRLLGESAKIRELRDMIPVVPFFDVAVLIQGERGTGKALVARIIHEIGPRSGGPFMRFDCAVADPNLLEVELFGHACRAFTGAHQLKIGKLEAANRGTIFLDEIGDLQPALQGKLVHVLEHRQFSRVGERSNVKIDVRVIAATNQDLERAIRAGEFREDLFYRLNVVSIKLPPLRERGGWDVVVLAEHFLAELCARSHLPLKTLTADAQAALMRYHWPGNVRELRSIVERAALLSDARFITVDALGMPRD